MSYSKIKVVVVTLGDLRKEFFLSRESIVNEELAKIREVLGERYDLYISDIVYDIEEAKKVADEIRGKCIRCVIIHLPVWATPNLAFRIAYSTDLPVMLLANKRLDSSSIVSLLAVAGTLEQTGKNCIRVVGDVRDVEVLKKVETFIQACNLVDTISSSSFGLIGGRSIGMGTTVADPSQWQKIFNVEFDHCDQYEIVYYANKVSQKEVELYLDWFKNNFNIRFGGLFTEESLEKQIRSYLALKYIISEKKYDFLALKCQTEMSDHYVLQCVSVALLNNNYDAEGPKRVIPTACESDCDGALTMKLLSICSGNQPASLVDIKYIDEIKKEFILANCGSMAPYFSDQDEPKKAMKKVSLLPHIFGAAGGAALQMIAKEGPVTVARLFRKNGKYILACFEGQLEMRPIEELRKTAWCYPHQFLKADIDYEKFLQTVNSNHLHTVYGRYCEVLKLFCQMKNIEYICYNNA